MYVRVYAQKEEEMATKETPRSFVSFTDNSKKHGSNAVYGFGFIGSVIYFLQEAEGFWEVILAIPQAIVWPAYVAYKLLQSFYG